MIGHFGELIELRMSVIFLKVKITFSKVLYAQIPIALPFLALAASLCASATDVPMVKIHQL